MDQRKIRKSNYPIWIGLIVLSVSILVIILASTILYRRTTSLLTENLRQRLLSISITSAAAIEAEDLDVLKTELDWQKPEWSRVVSKLHKIKYSNDDIVFMYIFRKKADNPEQMEFVADADSIDPYVNTGNDTSKYVDVNRDGIVEPDGPDKLQWPGQDYPEAVDIPETYLAYDGPLTNKELYTDAYGTVLTGYAPIKDDDGNVRAILATDIKADDFFTITRQTLQPFIIFIIVLAFIISMLIVIIILSGKRYTKSLEELNMKIQIANEGQANLIHIINHQIKGYLAKSRNIFSELLTEPAYNACTDEAKPMLEEGFKSLTEGVGFVKDFLDASNIERGTYTYNMEEFDFKTLVQNVAEQQKKSAEEKKLEYKMTTTGEDCEIKGDKAQLEQAVRNLIDNSIHYTSTGSINVDLAKKDGKVLLTVKDTGVGISEELKPRLFTKGGRGKDSLKINVNSTGFGLSFVKNVVDAHKGRVWAESLGEGKGSTFYLELPVT